MEAGREEGRMEGWKEGGMEGGRKGEGWREGVGEEGTRNNFTNAHFHTPCICKHPKGPTHLFFLIISSSGLELGISVVPFLLAWL